MARANSEGSVFFDKRRKRWIGRVSVPGTRGEKRRSVTGKTRREAEEKMQAKRRELATGSPLDRDTITVGEHLEAWLSSIEASVAPTSHERYAQNVRVHLVPALGDVPLKKLNPGQIESLKNSLLAELSPASVNHCLSTLSTALNQAVRWELIPKNPKALVRSVRDEPKGMRCLTEDEAARLARTASGTRREALYQLALKCGLRVGELLALKWEDLEGNELKVRRGVNTNLAAPRWGSTKTGRERSIVLEPKIVAALKRHQAIQAQEKLAAPGEAYENLGLIFADELGGVRRERNVLKDLRRDLATAGLPEVRFHDLRDTAATLLLGAGEQLHVVAEILGHKDPAMTLRRYAHVLPEAREGAARRMEGYPF